MKSNNGTYYYRIKFTQQFEYFKIKPKANAQKIQEKKTRGAEQNKNVKEVAQ